MRALARLRRQVRAGASACEAVALYAGPRVPYDRGPMRRPVLAPALLALLAAPSISAARPKAGSAPACGAKILPLVEGNSWTYQTVAAPLPAEPAIVRISPPLPKGFTITVKSVAQEGGDTVVTLEEKITYEYLNPKDDKKPTTEERLVTSTITCNAKKFDISPESFFFAGEPGGFGGVKLDQLDRKGTSWNLTKGTFGDTEWPEDLTVTWSREAHADSGAKLGAGKLEMERRFTPLVPESIVTKVGSFKAEKIAVTTTGRVTLESPLTPELEPMEMPAGWINQLWFVEGTGVVQSLNRYAHMYQLADSTLK